MPVGLTAMGSKIELEGTKMLTSRGVAVGCTDWSMLDTYGDDRAN